MIRAMSNGMSIERTPEVTPIPRLLPVVALRRIPPAGRPVRKGRLAALVALCAFAASCGSGGDQGHVAATGHGGATHSGTGAPSAVITRGEARKVIDNYVATLNRADKLRNGGTLGTVEADSSLRLGSEAYRYTKVSDPKNHTYAKPVVVAGTTLYIPRRTAGAPWWAAKIAWSKGRPIDGATAEFVVFTKAGSGWVGARRPGALPRVAVPAPLVGARGYTTELGASQASSLAVQPAQLANQAATYLNQAASPRCPRPGLCAHRTATVTVAGASSLTDMSDLSFWRKQTKGTVGVGDVHSASPDQTYALTTADGGALVWCDVDATLTLVPPGGATMNLQIPSFYTKGHPVTRASVPYVAQLLVYDPPRGKGTARVVADLSGPVAKS